VTTASSIRWAGHAASKGKMKNMYTILIEKTERKIPLRRPRRGWEDNIKKNLK
jgi:hypothetical protein